MQFPLTYALLHWFWCLDHADGLDEQLAFDDVQMLDGQRINVCSIAGSSNYRIPSIWQ